MNDDNKIHGTLGTYLRKSRELKGIGIDELSSRTKISLTMLQALESDDFRKLPAPIFVKGFIRTYLKELGLDSKEAVLFYELLSSPSKKPDTKIDKISERQGVKINKYGTGLSTKLLISAIALILILTTIGFYYFYAGSEDTVEQQVKIEPVVVQNETEKNTTEPAVVEDVVIVAPEPVHKVLVKAKKDLWVKAKIDNGSPFDFLLRTGTTRLLEGKNEVKILLGDASSATVEYNGTVLQDLGQARYMKSFVFPSMDEWKDALVY